MREIKFRGRRKNSSEWVYGAFLAIPKLCSYIYDVQPDGQATRYLVDEDTVGQFTGLKDADGREIYEGDVIQVVTKNPYWEFKKNFAVECNLNGFCVDGEPIYYWFKLHNLKVIGNVYDNPELLRGDGDA